MKCDRCGVALNVNAHFVKTGGEKPSKHFYCSTCVGLAEVDRLKKRGARLITPEDRQALGLTDLTKDSQ